MKRLFFLPAVLVASSVWAASQDRLVVHEWGTFTSLQDEQGSSIGGINTDDEPVPEFVHRISSWLVIPPTRALGGKGKGMPGCHPDVTMRLETPVIYFHPEPGWKPRPVDVHVALSQGWLTEYYPDAIFRAPGLDEKNAKRVVTNAPGARRDWAAFGHLPRTAGELSWKGLTLGGKSEGPTTSENVWLAPRAVDAAAVKNSAGEAEKFLFYRGAAHLDGPISVARKGGTLEIHDQHGQISMIDAPENLRIHAAWLVDVNAAGECAFRALGEIKWGVPHFRASTAAEFAKGDFRPENLAALKSGMREEIVREGLFPDEADALLNTWTVSYFKSPGLRLFYICPHCDIESVLRLDVPAANHVTRVMIGRIELVTPEQRALLAKLATDPEEEQRRDYLALGRFRNALLLDEEKRRPSPALKEFIVKNNLSAYTVDLARS